MPRNPIPSDGTEYEPQFERLEDRLLLTTIRGGEFFIYNNMQGDTVRISLTGTREDAVEVFAHHMDFGMTDLVGFMGGNPDAVASTSEVIGWPSKEEMPTRRVWDASKTNSWFVWNRRGDTYIDPSGYQITTTYGSANEIYAIYVVHCSPSTRLTISRLDVDPALPFSQTIPPWYTMVDPWYQFAVNLQDWITGDVTDAPADSGNVLVGAYHVEYYKPLGNVDPPSAVFANQPVYVTVTNTPFDRAYPGVPQVGLYPGSAPYPALPAGITVSSEVYRMSSEIPLGRSVGAVAANNDGGSIFAIDNSPFIGELVEPKRVQGNVGGDIRAIAVHPNGTFYAADHQRRQVPITLDTGTNAYSMIDMRTLAAYRSAYFTVEETTHDLVQFRPGAPDGQRVRSMGKIVMTADRTQTYQNFIALEIDPVTEQVGTAQLMGLAYPTSGGELELIYADVPTDPRPTVAFTKKATLQAAAGKHWGEGVVPTIAAMAMRVEGGLRAVYVVTEGNQIGRINDGTGAVYLAGVSETTVVADASLYELKSSVDGRSIPAIKGIEFIGDTMYALASDGMLYQIDLTQIAARRDIAAPIGQAYAPFAESLAYDPRQGARFYTIMEVDGVLRLGMIPVKASLIRISQTGQATFVNPLYDATQSTFGFEDVNGLDFRDPAGAGAVLYGVARVADLDPAAAPTPPGGMWFVRIDTSTGQTTRLARVVGPNNLSTLAYNPAGDVFYAVDPGSNQMYVFSLSDIYNGGTPNNDLDDTINLTGMKTFTVGAAPEGLAYGDIDADGDIDVVAVNRTGNSVTILRNVGGATLFSTLSTPSTVGTSPVHVVLADVNKDGRLDIITANNGTNNVSVMRATGPGTFAAAQTFAVGTAPTGVAVGDVNGDTNMDLVVSNSTGKSISVLLGNGTGTVFNAVAGGPFAVAGTPQGVVLADVDGDGYLDAITPNYDTDTVSVLMGKGDGTFWPHQFYAPESVWVGDLDGDGNLDIVAANYNGHTISVLRGDGAGGFEGRQTYATGTSPAAVALVHLNDDNADGVIGYNVLTDQTDFLDAVTANQGSNNVSVLLGNGNATFAAKVDYAVGRAPRSLAAAQLNDDSLDGIVDGSDYLDLVVSNRTDGTVSVLLGNGNGTFDPRVNYAVGRSPEAVALGDIDSDGIADIVVANRTDDTMSVLQNAGDGTFVAAVIPTYVTGRSPSAIVLGDLDSDGAADVVVANQLGSTVSVFQGAGDGTFAAQVTYPAGYSPKALFLADLNADGALDVAVVNQSGATVQDPGTVSVLMGRGNTGFDPPAAYTVGKGPHGVYIANVNNDQFTKGGNRYDRLDAVVVNYDDDSVSVLLGTGTTGVFSSQLVYTLRNSFTVGDGPKSVAVADMNGDGNADVVAANDLGSTVSVLLGKGEGTFQNQVSYSIGDAQRPQRVILADLNGDGELDVLAANQAADAVGARLGLGDGTLGGLLSYPVGDGPSGVALVDVNGDTRADLLTTNELVTPNGTVSVLFGNGDGSFGGTRILTDAGGGALDPMVGIDWVEMDGEWALLGVTSSPAGTDPTAFEPSESTLYSINWVTGVCTELDEVTRYDPKTPEHAANLTSLAYFASQPGYMWSTDRVLTYRDRSGAVVPDAVVSINSDGTLTHRLTGDTLYERDDGYRLSKIRLSSALMRSDGLGNVRLQTLLFDADVTRPFWYFTEVTAMDYDGTGVLYGVGKLRSLVPDIYPINPADPTEDEQTWLVTIDDVAPLLPNVKVASRAARLDDPANLTQVDEVSTITFAEDGTLYGVDADTQELFTFDQDLLGFDGNVTVIGVLGDDIVGLDYQPDYVTVISGYGDGMFGPRTTYAVDSGPYLAYPLSDLNRDGFLDIVTANEFGNTVSVIMSQTDLLGAFTGYAQQVTYPVGDLPAAAVTVDLNRDGVPDIVTANRGANGAPGTLSILLGGPTGVPQATQYSPQSLWMGQLNDDNLDGVVGLNTQTGENDFPDVITANGTDNTVTVLMGDADATFDNRVYTYTVGSDAVFVTAGQLNDDNNDGRLDDSDLIDMVVVNRMDATVSILLGNGDGTFRSPVNYDVGYAPVSALLVDLSGDSVLDLAVANSGENTISILLGVGDGTFQQATTEVVDYSPQAIAAGDVNRDGRTDLAVSTMYGTVSVLLARPDGTFDPQTSFAVGYAPRAIMVGHLNDDNLDGRQNAVDNLDIVTVNWWDDSVSVLVGRGDGTFQPAVRYAVGASPRYGLLYDLDEDGNLDVIVANENGDTVTVLYGNGDTTFAAEALPSPYAVGTGPVALTIGQLNDDNLDGVIDGLDYPDLVAANSTSQDLSVLLGTGVGTFQAQTTYIVGRMATSIDVGSEPAALAAGDLNRDGFADLVIADAVDNTVWVCLGDGAGEFPVRIIMGVGTAPSALAIGDVNRDGKLDIVVTNSGDNTITVMRGAGTGFFPVGGWTTYAVGSVPSSVALGDVNGDEYADIVVANMGTDLSPVMTLSLLTGRGDGTFAVMQTLQVDGRPRSVTMGDVNDDGDVDIVAVSETASSVSVLLGNGDGMFLGYVSYPAPYGSRTVALGNFDGDRENVVDIVVANRDSRLYAASADQLYTLDVATAALTAVTEVPLSGTFTGLSTNPADPDFLWGVAEFGYQNVWNYFLSTVHTSAEGAVQDMGRIIVSGTVAGNVANAGSIEVVELGYLWGGINVGRNLDTCILLRGGGYRPGDLPRYYPYPYYGASSIHVRGTMNRLETRGDTLYNAIDVDNNTSVLPPSRVVNELEYKVGTMGAYRAGWTIGNLVHLNGYNGWDNDTMATAQFLNHPTSDSIILEGAVGGDPGGPVPEFVPAAQPWYQDWFALPLEAGQTVEIQGEVWIMGMLYPFMWVGVAGLLFDSDGRWVDSVGFESWDDYGVGSRFRFDSAEMLDEQKPIIFTAPMAGTYYLAIVIPPPGGAMYHVTIKGLTTAALGGINVQGGNIATDPLGVHAFFPTDDAGRYVSGTPDNIIVENGGAIGGVVVSGNLGVVVHTIGGGSIASLEGGAVGGSVYSEGSIGRAGATSGGYGAATVAGYIGWDPINQMPYDQPYDWDAYIDNVFAKSPAAPLDGDIGGSFQATGSIGSMAATGDMLAGIIEVNSDEDGPDGSVDLIQVAGNWGQVFPVPIVPLLLRHRDGDIGYIHVGASIYQIYGSWIGLATEHKFDQGQSVRIYDDSGGALSISPQRTPLFDANGLPMIDPLTGQQATYTTAYSYVIIGVDDFQSPGSGDGGVIARLRIDGPASLNAVGKVKVCNLDLSYTAPPAGISIPMNISMGGTGTLDVYHVLCTQPWGNIINSTPGDIVSGDLQQGVNIIRTGGNIGSRVGKLGTWLHGVLDAPAVAETVRWGEPQYGWYRGKINGIQVAGNVAEVTAGGALGDLRVTGQIGKIVVNSDRQTPGGQWHGVHGIVWSGVRIDSIDVGDGLADDGPAAKAKAGIMSTFTIGSVTIKGPRYVRNGIVFGEIDGFVAGVMNDSVTVTLPGGTTAQQERDAIGQVIGADGAQLTALVVAMGLDSFYCFAGSFAWFDPELVGFYSGVGKIVFSGLYAQIHGFETAGNYVREVTASAGTGGIIDSFISANAAKPNECAIGRVAAGGPGMKHVMLSADGGDVGRLEGLDATSDMYYSDFVVTTGGINTIRARDIVECTIHAPEDVGTIQVGRDMLDMVLAGTNVGAAAVMLGAGDGTFDDPTEYPASIWPRALAVGDVDNDSIPDIIMTSEYYDINYLLVMLGTGFGGVVLTYQYLIESGPRAVALVDLNYDSNLDVVIANYKDASVTVMLGSGDGQFLTQRRYAVGQRPLSVAVGDLNGDEAPDIITANEDDNNISVLLGYGNGTFRGQRTFRVGAAPQSVATGQFSDDNGDGSINALDRLDVVVANEGDDTVSVMLNVGDINADGVWDGFQAQRTFAVGEYPSCVAVGDLSGDGLADLVVSNYNEHRISVLLGNGNGTFANQLTYPVGRNARYVVLGDLNNDLRLDVVVANRRDDTVSILLNLDDANLDGTWDGLGPQTTAEAGTNLVALALADMNQNGVLDIVGASKGEELPGLLAGAVNSFSVARNINDSYIKIAGPAGSVTVGNTFSNSTLLLPGTAADLKKFDVVNDISGVVESHGQIGSLVSRNGAIFADVFTTAEEGAVSNDVGLISTKKGFFGQLEVAGSLKQFTCYTSLGIDPRIEDNFQHFVINGDLGTLMVTRDKGAVATSDLYADLSVGGTVTKIQVDGTLFGDLAVHGNLKLLAVANHLGFHDPATGIDYGSVDVLGAIDALQFPALGDLVADIISGGSIKALAIKSGSIRGDIVSRYGDVTGVSITDGDLLGSVSGRSIGAIAVTNGDIRGDITTTGGSVKAIKLTAGKGVANGRLLGNVSVTGGRVESLQTSGGDVGSETVQYTLRADRGFKQIAVKGGRLLANIYSGGVIDALNIAGAAGQVVVRNVTINSDAGIKKLDVTGDLSGATIRSGGKIDSFNVKGNMTDSTVSAAWDIGTANVAGNMTNSLVLAGYDVGTDAVGVLTGNGNGTLDAPRLYPYGNEPRSVAAADLDLDGDTDLVVANGAADSISVLLNAGGGRFTRSDWPVGGDPACVAAADLDGLNQLDLVVVNETDNTISVLLSDGAGGYVRTDYAVGASPVFVAVGDLDGANQLDLVVVNQLANTISVLLSSGAGTFAGQVLYAVGISPGWAAIGDVDQAGQLDLAVANQGGDTVSVLLSNGPGTFAAQTAYAAGDSPSAVAIGDLDGLNQPDLVVALRDADAVAVLLSDGAGGYDAAVGYDVDASPVALALVNLDGAGGLDVLTANRDGGSVSVLLGAGDGTFAAQTAYAVGGEPAALALGDVDGDGLTDVVVANQGQADNALHGGTVHSGNIASVSIGGNFDGSVIAAGISPGLDGSFVTQADNAEAAGVSSILKLAVKGQFLNRARSAVLADTGIDAKFLTLTQPGGPAFGVQVPATFITNVLNGAGQDFGVGTALPKAWVSPDGTLTISISNGRANFNNATGDLVLEETAAKAGLQIKYTAAAPRTINITGSDDSGLGTLAITGNIVLGNIGDLGGANALDGAVGTLTAGEVLPGANWYLPGGVASAKLTGLGGMDTVNVTVGAVGTWAMAGPYSIGNFTADAVLKGFQAVGDSGANFTTTAGDLAALKIAGDYSGQIASFNSINKLDILGEFTGGVMVSRGDLLAMTVAQGFVGTLTVEQGVLGALTVANGDFGGAGDIYARSASGVGTFTVANGAFSGLLSTGGDILNLAIAKGEVSGRIRARGSIQKAAFGSTNGAIVAAGGSIGALNIVGDMAATSVYAGFDPGDDPDAEAAYNIQIDALTPPVWRTALNADQALGGSIGKVQIGGNVSPWYDPSLQTFVGRGSTISAAVDPGRDGYVGTYDDWVRGAGVIDQITVKGGVYGTGVESQSYGFFAASAKPKVTWWGKRPFEASGNARVGAVPPSVGLLKILEVTPQARSVIITFNHPVNMGTINTRQIDVSSPNTFYIFASTTPFVVDANGNYVVTGKPIISDTVANKFIWNPKDFTLTFELAGTRTWRSLVEGPYFLLAMDGSAVADPRGTLLDGDADGTPGGNYAVEFQAM